MIDRGDIRQAIDRWYIRFTAALSRSVRVQGRQPDCKFKEAGGTVREIGCMSRVTAIISGSGYLHHRLPAAKVNHCDNAITYKAQRDKKCQQNWSWRTAITDMQMRQQRDVAALDAKYTKELADAVPKNDALRDDVAAGRRRLHIKAVCQSVRSLTPPAWIMQPSPWLADTGDRDYLPSERADHYAKTTGRNSRSILMSSADRVAHIDGQLMQLLWAIHTRASSGV